MTVVPPLLAIITLTACAAPTAQVTPSWWHGRWVVDGDRLFAPGELARLPAGARDLAIDLGAAAAPEYRFEFSAGALRREAPEGERTVAYRLVRADGRSAELRSGDAVVRLERRPGGIVLHQDGRHPLPLQPLPR